ncbi:MAG: response regulator receiver modulated CheB methylesterase [Thermoleophilia bacterium]|nr:response regulator receiver modulated CheB methylesterase [Thermoleophilia bacterium]
MDPRPDTPIRVVVADDSAVMRRLVGDALAADARIEVVGTASDGVEALARCAELRPDVLTLDLSMPNTNGLDVLARLAARGDRVRVVVVSSFSPTLIERALDVLDAGATDLVAKPRSGESFAAFGLRVVETVVAASTRRAAPTAMPNRVAVPRATRASAGADRVLVIASSTGGPRALGDLVPRLRPDSARGTIIVQHMPAGFTAALARRLDATSPLGVREAAPGDRLSSTQALVAPAGRHLRFDGDVARLDDGEPIGGVRPRADVTVRDLVGRHGAAVVLVVLTGMGSDGLDGARAVREAGGIVLAQDEADCVVYGMPRQVVEADLADATGTLPELPELIERALGTPIPRRR